MMTGEASPTPRSRARVGSRSLSDGPPVLSNVAAAPTFADAQAAIIVVLGRSTSIKTDVNLKSLVGRRLG